MKVFFVGSVQFSHTILNELVKLEGIEVVGIATKSQSSFNADHFDLSKFAIKNNIPYKFIKDINADKNIEWIEASNPEVIFCFGWSSLIKNKLLNLAPKGVVGYHPTNLPHNRGRHPLIWALCLGLEETASSFFIMREGADDGPIVSQKVIKIDIEDDAASLYNKIEKAAKEQLPELLENLRNNVAVEQDHSKANYWRKRGKQDGKIDFRMSSLDVYNLIRALTKPYVGAHLKLDDEEYKVWRGSLGPSSHRNIEPGKILNIKDNSLLVKCGGDTSIWLEEHELIGQLKINDYIK